MRRSHAKIKQYRAPRWPTVLVCTLVASFHASGQGSAAPGVLVEKSGEVLYSKIGEGEGPAVANQPIAFGDKLRTLESSRATVRFADLTEFRLKESTAIELLPPQKGSREPVLSLTQGAGYFFSRAGPKEMVIRTPQGEGEARGTEFELMVEDHRTLVVMYDGVVDFTNAAGPLSLGKKEVGIFPDSGPPRVEHLESVNIVQWWLYYPGVLDPGELAFNEEEKRTMGGSLEAYRAGDLLQALHQYPVGLAPVSDTELVYRAQLLLNVGALDQANELLKGAQPDSPMARAVRALISAVTNGPPPEVTGRSASEKLAWSYYLQSQRRLADALDAARSSVQQSPDFGLGWERVADLEFSFGRLQSSAEALERSLNLAPRNAQAHALKGLVFSGQGKIESAIAEFNIAIALDSSLPDAWLGRGLCRIKRGEAKLGREDLQTAVLLEPNRAFLHAYLGKAFADAGRGALASLEFQRAEGLDPKDPTPWLYSALLKREQNDINAAVDDLQKSIARNDNRAAYRSRLLLEQDQAVRSTSLAKIYQDAGMNEVSVAEASRAVDYDYADYSAHLFLADSLNALRDPTRFNLRYETAWFNELLLANLLAPAGARPISQNVSQQEYSRLLAEDRPGFDLTSQYRSDRQLQEVASQYGAFGSTSYSLDLTYQHNDGMIHPYRTNNSLSDIEWYSQIKQQLGPNDALTAIIKYENYHSGDNFQYNNPANASPYFHYHEYQTPIAVAAWHHEWGPGVHTLVLAGRLTDDQNFINQNAQIPVLPIQKGFIQPFMQTVSNYSLANDLNIYTAEFNQLISGDIHTWNLGVRYQEGDFHTKDLLTGVAGENPAAFPNPPAAANITSPFRRVSAYAYHYWQVFPSLLLTVGITDDEMTYPDNFRFAPISSGEASRRAISPKVALTWNPLPSLTFRGAYCQALGGASFDESFTLEPTELAGFNQAFRSVISESLIGSVAGPRYQVFGGAMDLKLQSQTFLTLQVESLESDLNEHVGVFSRLSRVSVPPPNFEEGTAPEELRYQEPSVSLTLNQLLGPYLAAGAGYRYTHSTLNLSDAFILGLAPSSVENDQLEAQLHEVSGYLQFTHPSGIYARAEVQWYHQINSGYAPGTADPPVPVSKFTPDNLSAGWVFWRRRGDVTFGVLNVAGRDYSLNPLNVYNELPHSRVLMGRLRLNF